MKISRKKLDSDFEQWRDWHVLTISKFLHELSALDFYGRFMHGVDVEIVRSFADQINKSDETGSLYPKAPVSAIPWRYFDYIEEWELPTYLDQFRGHIKAFIEMNRTKIHARKIVVDFHRDADPVSDFYLTSAERAFKEFLTENEVDEVVLLQ